MRRLLLVSSCAAMPTYALDIAQIDQLTLQWLNIEQQHAQLKKNWHRQKPLLIQQLALLTTEKKQLMTLITDDDNNTKNVDIKRKTLLKEQSQLEQQQTKLTQQLALLTSQLTFINHLLPPPLKKIWQKEHQVLGADPELSLQLQVALAKMASLAEFEQRITLHEMPLTSPQGVVILVKQLYLGTGIAWFTSADGQYCGWGQADEKGWSWHFDPQESAKPIMQAIAIFEKKRQADFVELPIKISNRAIAVTVKNSMGES
ncbi:MAG: DUF3450 family protein [Colwellia sp.]|nr:DUF3450 family protein [Colwellia sp.]